MAILSGRYGQVLYDPTGAGGATLVEVTSLNHWTLDQAVDYEEVTSFGDPNKVYVPGLPDASGTIEGFWNSTELAIWEAATATVPGMLKLVPNRNEATFFWTGLAYLNASIDVSLAVPTVAGEWRAAGPWSGPEQPPALLEAGAPAATAPGR
jgi:hypothetical protein